MDIFKSLILVVVAAALLYALGNILGLFKTESQAIELIQKQLKVAEGKLGKTISEEILFNAGAGVSAKNFEGGRRIIGLECNSARVCCPEREKCEKGEIEWSAESIFVKEEKKILVSTVCEIVAERFSCKIFFGENPAQLEITGINAQQQFDVRKEKPKIIATVENKGALPVFDAVLSVEVFVKFEEQGIEKKRLMEEKQAVKEIGKINPGETTKTEIELDISEIGRFEAVIKASARNSGSDRKSILFSTTKSSGNCRADKEREKELFWIESSAQGDVCGQKHYCLECEFGFECLNMWEKEGATELEIGNSGFAFKKVSC